MQRWLAYGTFPERKHGVSSTVDQHGSYLEIRYREGCRHIQQLWQQVKQIGFGGQASTVRGLVAPAFWLAQGPIATACEKASAGVSAADRMANAQGESFTAQIPEDAGSHSPEIASLAQTARKLFEILRNHDAAAWPEWLDRALHSPLAGFARHLRRDKEPVTAALMLPWSNGIVEGQIHRLKLIKRQMHGRASFDLLRRRVLVSV